MHKITPSHCTSYASPLGTMWLAASQLGLCGVWFEGQAHAPRWAASAHDPASAAPGSTGAVAPPSSPRPQPDPNHPVLQATAAWLDRYFQGQAPDQLPPLDARIGTDFQRAVWQALRTIPPGATRSYGELARAIGRPKAQRAVGAAVGRNPWSVLVPCHRVLGQGGALTGYAGGLARKQALLALEGVQ
ncbi:MAG: methylated-DNA--[protein]-cysteine S-methyltransferase [Burkholderiaceae bacterium]|nr:methylated-DNA--[protein]-cysteine S-methyltransferase [Burkholderiaceae bacterium]MDP3423624.1 methylated-DNA--[protein]-cysteine S-methyltransferase [Burkholderiaceae bacterium]